MPKTKDEIEQENRERLRLARIRNYRIKRSAKFRCSKCGTDAPTVVVQVSPGENDEDFDVRCQQHREDLPVALGQMAEMD